MLNNWSNIYFAHPNLLWLIPVCLVFFVLWFVYRHQKQYGSFIFTTTAMWQNYSSWKGKFLTILPLLRFLTIAAIVVALARPQTSSSDQKIKAYGIDMVLSMDVSLSMLARDFIPDRLEAAKDVASKFIANRPNDRIGLVIFSGESFTQVPITTDHKIVQQQLDKIKYGLLQDGTAIGLGIGTAINRLKNSPAKSKVIILMTDGVNTAGEIDPMIAAEAAEKFNVKIYTIGIGSKGNAEMPYFTRTGEIKYGNFPVEIDEKLLTDISNLTGGKYYRAENKKELSAIYADIDQLEKTEIESSQTINITELFYPFAAFAIFLLFIEQVLKFTLLRTFP